MKTILSSLLLVCAVRAAADIGVVRRDFSVNPQPATLTLSWTPPTPDFTLQFTESLSPTNWVNAPSGTNNPATVPATLPARFFRLSKP